MRWVCRQVACNKFMCKDGDGSDDADECDDGNNDPATMEAVDSI